MQNTGPSTPTAVVPFGSEYEPDTTHGNVPFGDVIDLDAADHGEEPETGGREGKGRRKKSKPANEAGETRSSRCYQSHCASVVHHVGAPVPTAAYTSMPEAANAVTKA